MNEDTEVRPNSGLPRKRRPFRRVATVAAGLAAIYVAWCGFLYVVQDDLVFPKDMAPEVSPRFPWHWGESVRMTRPIADGVEVEARLLLSATGSADDPAPLVVILHGNAETIEARLDLAEVYWRMGCSVLLPEYRGYGGSGGEPSQTGIVEDVVWFYDQTIALPDIDGARVVQHGVSLGGGVAAQLAGRRRPAGLILESTFISGAAMARKYFAPMFLAKHPFRTDRVLRRLDCPVLVLHGDRDRIIPISHGRQLHATARDSRFIEFACGHNDFPGDLNIPAYHTALKAFLVKTGLIEP